MKIKVARNDLLATLSRVQPVVDRHHTTMILHNLLLSAEKSTLSLTASDLELEVVAQTPASIKRLGKTTVLAHELYDWIRKLSDTQEPINIEAEGSFLILRSGRARSRLPCHEPERFPRFAPPEDPQQLALPAHHLLKLFDQTLFAASTDDHRPYLTGVFLRVLTKQDDPNSWLLAVATDGHRLARMELPFTASAPTDDQLRLQNGVIIPRKAIARMRVLLKELAPDDEVQLILANNTVRFQLPHYLLTSKLVEGEFPAYEKVIPTANDKLLIVEKRALIGAIERAAVLSDRQNSVRLNCKPDTLTISATGDDGRNAHEDLDCSYTGEPIEIGFNYRYLLEIVHFAKEQVHIALDTPFSPVLIKSLPDDQAALFVLMPLRM